jgi:hypothetical protein
MFRPLYGHHQAFFLESRLHKCYVHHVCNIFEVTILKKRPVDDPIGVETCSLNLFNKFMCLTYIVSSV